MGEDAADKGDAPLDDDLNLDDIDDIDGDPDEGDDDPPPYGAPGGYEPVEDFDLGMSEEDRTKQMNACFMFTMSRMQSRQNELQQTIQEMLASPQGQKMSQSQAVNTLMFSWMMACYMNIESAQVMRATPNAALSPE